MLAAPGPVVTVGAVCAAAELIVSVDTAAFHWGGILGRPTLGLFNVNDGATYCRYYPTARAVQLCETPCINTKYRTCPKHYTGRIPEIPGVAVSRCYHPNSVMQVLEAIRATQYGD